MSRCQAVNAVRTLLIVEGWFSIRTKGGALETSCGHRISHSALTLWAGFQLFVSPLFLIPYLMLGPQNSFVAGGKIGLHVLVHCLGLHLLGLSWAPR